MPCSSPVLQRRLGTAVSIVLLVLIGSVSLSAQSATTGPPGGSLTDDAALGVVRQIGRPAGPVRTGAELETVTETVSSKLRCPVCQGMSVADSPSASARAMKNEIEELLAQGYSPEQVNQYFESTYGEFVLLDPKRKGLNWLVWLAPGTIFLGGLFGISFILRRRMSAPPQDLDLDPYLSEVRARVNHEDAPSAGQS